MTLLVVARVLPYFQAAYTAEMASAGDFLARVLFQAAYTAEMYVINTWRTLNLF